MSTIRRTTITMAGVALLLAACGTAVEGSVGPAVQPATTISEPAASVTPMDSIAPEATTSEVTPTEEAPAEDNGDIVTTFGKTVTWNDGLAFTVSTPRVYRPGDSAAGATKHNVVFTMTLKNGTNKRVDPSMLYIKMADAEGDVDAVFDYPNMTGGPNTSLRAGKSVTWKAAFGLHSKSMTGLTMEVEPLSSGLEQYRTAIFEN